MSENEIERQIKGKAGGILERANFRLKQSGDIEPHENLGSIFKVVVEELLLAIAEDNKKSYQQYKDQMKERD